MNDHNTLTPNTIKLNLKKAITNNTCKHLLSPKCHHKMNHIGQICNQNCNKTNKTVTKGDQLKESLLTLLNG